MQLPYKFVNNERIPTTAPNHNDFELCKSGVKLTREQKDKIFHSLQSNSGKHNYKMSGWVYPFKQFMKRYFVVYTEGDIREIYAFDKTCIRYSYYTKSNILEIHEIK